MRIAFMGTPAFAVPALDALCDAGHKIEAVYCQPPRPAHRGQRETQSPVEVRAKALGLAVSHPASLKTREEQAAFAALDLDLAIVAAYGLILPQAILDVPRLGCVNIHASLLPRWRGAAPVQRAILAGDVTTGVTIMQMDAGLDTGPMLHCAAIAVGDQTAGDLTETLAMLGAATLLEWLDDPARFTPVAQPADGVTYAAKITKQEALLDFSEHAEMLLREVRAFSPAPGAFFMHDDVRYRVHAAELANTGPAPPGTVVNAQLTIACATGAIRPTVVQRAGKPRMPTAEFLRGNAFPPGTRIG